MRQQSCGCGILGLTCVCDGRHVWRCIVQALGSLADAKRESADVNVCVFVAGVVARPLL